jgi:Heparinase II/III-like protein/Heparinase II/III N-terminus
VNLRKLKRRSIDELRVRGKQKLAVWVERRGWSERVRLPDDSAFLKLLRASSQTNLSSADLLSLFRERAPAKFFPAFSDRSSTTNELKKRWPENVQELLEQVQRIQNGCFDVFSIRGLPFGTPPDWHLEPISGKRSGLVHWSRINELEANETGDKKFVWELNRHQYFITLGRAYWVTADERYAEIFVGHITSWFESNPPALGINWLSSLEVSFRAISWLWALHFFKHSPHLTPEVFLRILKYLFAHGRHIETYLSTYSSPNTHLTGEALGLFYLGSLLPEFSDASRWRTTGERIMLAELERHVRPDGVYFEQSSYYHRYTTDFYTHFYILACQQGKVFADLSEKLQLLLDHLMYITRPDGTTPLFGDDDGGKLLKFEQRAPTDFRAALSNGAALFNRADFKFVAENAAEETLWLLGPEGLAAFDQLAPEKPKKTSMAFPDGGYYVMRDGWEADSNYLLFDCGPHGAMNCGHAHADSLAFQLSVNGRTLLIDPGTFTYTGSKEERDWFRSSAAHNTLTIDRQSSSVPEGPFSWRTSASAKCDNWISRDRFDFVKGSHDGYWRLSQPAAHSRSILFLKENYWIIRDSVASNGEHQADLWFHFETETTPLIRAVEGNEVIVTESDGSNGLDIAVFGEGVRWRREEGRFLHWVSHCYGAMEPARLYVSSVSLKSDGEIVTFLLPQDTSVTKESQIREVEALGGKAFQVTHDRGLDIVMLRNSKAARVETERLASDFEWTWARFAAPQQTTPTELVLINGEMLELQGREILKSTKRIKFLIATQVGEKLSVETEAGMSDLSLTMNDLETVFAKLVSEM